MINSGDRKLRVSVPFVSFIASLCSIWKAEPKKLRVFPEDLRAVTTEKAKGIIKQCLLLASIEDYEIKGIVDNGNGCFSL